MWSMALMTHTCECISCLQKWYLPTFHSGDWVAFRAPTPPQGESQWFKMLGKQWSSFKVTDCWNSQPADSTDSAVYFMRAMKVLVTEHFMQFIAAITHSNTDKYICYFNHYSVKIGMILRKPERKNRTVIAAFLQRCKIGSKLDEPKIKFLKRNQTVF